MQIQQTTALEHPSPGALPKQAMNKQNHFNLFGLALHDLRLVERESVPISSGQKGIPLKKDAAKRHKTGPVEQPQALLAATSASIPVAFVVKGNTAKATVTNNAPQKNDLVSSPAHIAGKFTRKGSLAHAPREITALPAKAVAAPYAMKLASADEKPQTAKTIKPEKPNGEPRKNERNQAPNLKNAAAEFGDHIKPEERKTPATPQPASPRNPFEKPVSRAMARHAVLARDTEQARSRPQTPPTVKSQPTTGHFVKPVSQPVDTKDEKHTQRIKTASAPITGAHTPEQPDPDNTRHAAHESNMQTGARLLELGRKAKAIQFPAPQGKNPTPTHAPGTDRIPNNATMAQTPMPEQTGPGSALRNHAARQTSSHNTARDAHHRPEGSAPAPSEAISIMANHRQADDMPDDMGNERSGVALHHTYGLTQVAAPENHATGKPPPIARHVTKQIVHAATALHDGPVEISLAPKELGHVRMTLHTQENGTMAVAIQAERPQALDLMRRNIDQLAADLRELGYDGLTFSFSENGHHGNENPAMMAPDAPEHLSAETNPAAITADAAMPVTRIALDITDGIDIRL